MATYYSDEWYRDIIVVTLVAPGVDYRPPQKNWWDQHQAEYPDRALLVSGVRQYVQERLERKLYGEVVTENYLVFKWFDILGTTETVRFKGVYLDENGSPQVEFAERFFDLKHNHVLDAYSEMYGYSLRKDVRGNEQDDN